MHHCYNTYLRNMKKYQIIYQLLCIFSSPKNQPVIAVITNVRELVTGTAKDISALLKLKKYNKEPPWLIINGIMYCKNKSN